VFVEASAAEMEAEAIRLGLQAVQWHGDGTPPNVGISPIRLIAAYRIRDKSDLEAVHRDLEEGNYGAILMDAHVAGEYGGTGQTAPWQLLADFDFDTDIPLILAGGLTPENVAEAIRIVRPYGVDVASGVESSPGIKDAEKMRRFVAAVRSAV
jgi:phosphoribosylanthranilate isomerase